MATTPKKLSRRKFIALLGLGALGYALADALFLEHYFFGITHHQLGTSGNNTKKLRLVQLSDLHLNSKAGAMHRRLVKEVNRQQPDVILFTGDTCEHDNGLEGLEYLLKHLNPEAVKVAIPGNWEYWGGVGFSGIRKLFTAYNGHWMVNRSQRLNINGQSITFCGVDDLLGGLPDIDRTLNGITGEDPVFILSHCPAQTPQLAKVLNNNYPHIARQVQAIFSGHTHGGQITLFGWAPYVPPGSGKFVKGWHTVQGHRMYVSKGLGTTLIPVRFFARAEMAVFDWYPADPAGVSQTK